MALDSFDYDELNRLTYHQIDGQAEQRYGFDAIGNLLRKSGVGTGDYSYPAQGAQHQILSNPAFSGKTTFYLSGKPINVGGL